MSPERERTDPHPHQSLWTRWTGESGGFYRSCAVWPVDTLTEQPPGDDDSIEQPELKFCTGSVRIALRNMPVLILVLGGIGITLGHFNESGPYSPIGTYLPIDTSLPSFGLVGVFLLPAVILWAAFIARIFSQAIGQEWRNPHRSILFFGTTSILLAGVVFSIYLVVTGQLTDPRQHLTFRAGYFLFLLLEAHLVYDGLVLRGEHFFSNFGENAIVNADAYDEFRQQLVTGLGEPVSLGPITISRAALIAIVILAPIGPIPIIIHEPQFAFANLVGAVSYTITMFFQFLVIAVLFQFVVLLWYFNKLLTGEYLTYKPFHPDEHGGYRDLGRFATRINIILVVGGGYVVFRFFTSGLQQLNLYSMESPMNLFSWLVSFIGPIVVYGAVILLWLYFSFYRIHRQMKNGRRRKINELQAEERNKREVDQDRPEERRLEHPDIDGRVWESLQNAPVWPISRQGLAGVMVLDILPILISLLA